jgi:hypothetical protein
MLLMKSGDQPSPCLDQHVGMTGPLAAGNGTVTSHCR